VTKTKSVVRKVDENRDRNGSKTKRKEF
jgi:hypothetical protein